MNDRRSNDCVIAKPPRFSIPLLCRGAGYNFVTVRGWRTISRGADDWDAPDHLWQPGPARRRDHERKAAMTIATGDRVPDVKVFTFGDKGPEATTSTEVLGKGKVVLFGVPGAFTPTCSDHHLPGFVLRAEELRSKGADKVVCVSVNDPFVMGAWGADQNVGDSVVMLADGNGELAAALGLTMDGSGFGLGSRVQRFAAIIDDGVVSFIAVEPGPGLSVSSAEEVLAAL